MVDLDAAGTWAILHPDWHGHENYPRWVEREWKEADEWLFGETSLELALDGRPTLRTCEALVRKMRNIVLHPESIRERALALEKFLQCSAPTNVLRFAASHGFTL